MTANLFSGKTLTIIAIFILTISAASISAQDTQAAKEVTGKEQKIRIGVLYINTPSGNKHWEGIKEAFENKAFKEITKYLELLPDHYPDGTDGFETLQKFILGEAGKERVDIVLGPTESDIFVRGVSKEKDFVGSKVPVISGLVTAKVGNRSGGWFFRTNVDVTRRVHTIYDFLNKHWISTSAVIYSDTEFGRRAKRAFYEELKMDNKEDSCMELLYDNPPDSRKQLHAIFKDRPEAVGVFGEREDLEQIYNQYKRMNGSWKPYNPYFFTILDVRTLKNRLDDIYFVSLTGEEIETEVKALGYDLGVLVIQVLDAMNRDGQLFKRKFDGEKREEFRRQLATSMRNTSLLPGTKTGMVLNNFENTTLPSVYHLKNGEAKRVPIPEYIGLLDKFFKRLKLIFAVYGSWMMWLVLGVVLLLTVSVSRMEVKRLFPQKHISIYRRPVFYFYTLGHIITVMIIFVFLAETGSIKYDNIYMVIIISMTPTAFLHTTFFETRQGRAIGLENIYKNLMTMIEENIMQGKYKSLEAITNVIAYYSPLQTMRRALLNFYKNHPSQVQRAKLIQKMEEDIDKEPEHFEKRRVAAKLLMRWFDLDQLKAEGLLPQEYDYKNPLDPRLIIRRVARYCSGFPEKIEKIDQLLKDELKALKKRSETMHKEFNDSIDAEKNLIIAKEGELNVKIRKLFVLRSFDIEWLIAEELFVKEILLQMSEDIESRSRTRGFWSQLYENLKKFIRKLFGMVVDKDEAVREYYKSLEFSDALANVIAYNNSLDSIRKALEQVYKNYPSKEQQKVLIRKMEDDLKQEPAYLSKRRIGARLLIRQYDMDQLKAEGFVPLGWDYETYGDPRIVIRKAARYCVEHPEKGAVIDQRLKEELKELEGRNPERFKEVEDFMKRELSEVIAREGILIVNLRNLFVLIGFDTKRLIEEGLFTRELLSEIQTPVETENELEKKGRFW